MTASQADWERLGEMLQDRRVELGTRYRNLTLFSSERGIDYRLAWDIEHSRRTNYRRLTLAAIEVSYGWQRGSIKRVLAGEDPLPVNGQVPQGPQDPLTPRERQLARNLEHLIRAAQAEQDEGRKEGNGAA